MKDATVIYCHEEHNTTHSDRYLNVSVILAHIWKSKP